MDKTDILQTNINGISNGVNTRTLHGTSILVFIFAVLMFTAIPSARADGSCLVQGKCTIASDCSPTQSCVDAYYLPELHTWNARGGVACGGTCVADPAKAGAAPAATQTCTVKDAPCSYNGISGKCVEVQVGTDTVLTCNAASGPVVGSCGTGGTGTCRFSCTAPEGWVPAFDSSCIAAAPKCCMPGRTAPIQTSIPNPNAPIQTSIPNPANTGQVVTLMNPLGNNVCSSNGTCLMNFLNSILKLVIQIGAVVVVLMLVYVGFLFVVAQGNESKLTTAKNALLWTVIGALVLLGAQAIASGIQATIQALGG